MLEHVGERPEACVFIDDAPHNAEGARAVGIHAIQHRSGAETAAALRALGVTF
jgi:FMN phosphatase YigB (HAD superfamily)